MKEYTVELPDGTKAYIVEFMDEPNKTCALELFLKSLDFVKDTDEFKTAQLHRYLKCGYGTVSKVLDALCTLCVIEKISGPPSPKYKSLLKNEPKNERIDHG